MATCAYTPCKKQFTPKRPWQIFCSSRCRNKYHVELRQRALRQFRGEPDPTEKKDSFEEW